MTATMVCEHTPSTDPRRRGACIKCGKVMPQPMDRDVEDERAITRHAGLSRGVDTAGLIEFAEQRAHEGPVLRRDLGRELREEIADARSYAVWKIQEMRATGDDNDFGKYARALGILCELYAVLEGQDEH